MGGSTCVLSLLGSESRLLTVLVVAEGLFAALLYAERFCQQQ